MLKWQVKRHITSAMCEDAWMLCCRLNYLIEQHLNLGLAGSTRAVRLCAAHARAYARYLRRVDYD